VQLGVHWLVNPRCSSANRRARFTDGKLTDETTRKFSTDQMIAFEDWIKRMKRAFA